MLSAVLFLSTLSLRRATCRNTPPPRPRPDFYPRSPCGERPAPIGKGRGRGFISIHALLAESDHLPSLSRFPTSQFLSTLSLRRATASYRPGRQKARHFYPRSPCGERRTSAETAGIVTLFLSTLSLRRATAGGGFGAVANFYPRSPCGERLKRMAIWLHPEVFLSTLSLRRAT